MKKILTLLVVGLMLFASIGTVFAIEGDDLNELTVEKGMRFNILKEFTDEMHRINELRIERLNLRSQVIEKHDAILDLYIEAREEGNREALLKAREVKQQIKEINKEIKEIHEQLVEERRSFKEEAKNGNIEKAKEYIDNVISLMESINEKISQKIVLLNDIISILS